MTNTNDTLLECRRIVKSYSGVTVLKDVDFEMKRGEIHAVVGENGAGKSTLMRIAFGLIRPDTGTVCADSRPIASAHDSIAARIGMVHQHFTNVAAMTVAENVALGGRGTYRADRAARRVLEIGAGIGLDVPMWVQGPSLALVSVMIFAVWQSMGFDVIIFLAGLTNINSELYEAGRIDGANGWQLFRHITVPLLMPTTFLLLVISIIGSFQAFNHIFTMNVAASQPLGGPLGTTRTVSIYMFDQLYSQNRAGYATSIAVILSLIIFALTLVQFRFFERGGEEGGS